MQTRKPAGALANQQSITTWLKQRQSLLVALYELCHHRPFFLKLSCQELRLAMEEFGGQVIDYLSLMHFKIYEQVVSSFPSAIPTMVHSLNESTQQILDLCDRSRFKLNPIQLDKDLGALAEKLAKRFELEDRFISTQLGSQKLKTLWQH